jgi:hypothetical protein
MFILRHVLKEKFRNTVFYKIRRADTSVIISYLTTIYQLIKWRNIILFASIITCWFDSKENGRAENKRHSVELYQKSYIVWSICWAGVTALGRKVSKWIGFSALRSSTQLYFWSVTELAQLSFQSATGLTMHLHSREAHSVDLYPFICLTHRLTDCVLWNIHTAGAQQENPCIYATRRFIIDITKSLLPKPWNCLHKVKLKLSLGLIEDVRESGGIAPPFLTSELDGGEWLVSRPGPFTPRERVPGIHWTDGPQIRSGHCGIKKNLLPLLGIEPWLSSS